MSSKGRPKKELNQPKKVPRLNKGENYWVIIQGKTTMFEPKMRTEEGNNDKGAINRLDELYSEVGNYFYTLDDCNKRIEKWIKKNI